MIMIEFEKMPTTRYWKGWIWNAVCRSKTPRTWLGVCVFAFFLVPSVFATQREVGSGQTYGTIQSCMNAAASGDICNVHTGTYAESVTFKTAGVTLQVNSGDTVVLNGTIDILSFANSIVDGFQVTGFSVSSYGGIHAYNTTGGIIRNNVVHDAAGSGIYVRLSANFQVYGNTVYNMTGPCCGTDGDGIVTVSNNSTDGTYAHGVQIYNNEVYQNHQDGVEINGVYQSVFNNYVHDNIYSNWASVHPDGIECNGIADGYTGCPHTLVYNNIVKNQSQNIYFYGNGTVAQNSDIWIFNNVVYNDPTSSTGVSTATGTSSQIILGIGQTAYILNNTIGGTVQYFDICLGDCSGGNDATQTFTGVTVRNNIITNSLYIGLWTYPSTSITAMDNNIYYNNASALVHWGTSGNLTSITTVRSTTGMEASGQQANPLINAFPTPTLQAGSPAIAAGANLTSLTQAFLDSDKNGSTRPSSGAWDVGAYSFGTAATRPNPPTNLKATAQ
jgi:parallel beta-helix repeat protein